MKTGLRWSDRCIFNPLMYKQWQNIIYNYEQVCQMESVYLQISRFDQNADQKEIRKIVSVQTGSKLEAFFAAMRRSVFFAKNPSSTARGAREAY